ncbi:SpaA isopeptide-forming pilin-related protein [Lacinutrix sp. Bg11-31]|uniref:SpaA isopeptide-forming pilin-related protein n=1 Tax=Lacinutrix sp. Bg11-31 TaxID=2057808 RepID=UPI0012FD6F0F|nr:SpaA isopeptide-forming pilin-related protein [Lacinutrix sp. Bg11-31]
MKNQDLKSLFFAGLKLIVITLVFSISFSCSDEGCEYDDIINQVIPPGCALEADLNLSTGIDANGNVIAAAFGAVDPFWKIINQPPLYQGSPGNPCTSSAVGTFTGETYSMNFGQAPNAWVNQSGAATLAPFDLGPNGSFGCNNAINGNGTQVPYVFERSFCVLEDTNVDFNFTFKGDDQVRFELIKNEPFSLISTSTTYVWSPNTGIQTWTATNLPLSVGSYSIRGELVNTGAIILGFSFLGNMTTTNGDEAISNNTLGCCENNTISVLNILEQDCDRVFNNSTDAFGDSWSFSLLDSTGSLIRTGTTDINGNLFFSGLPDGTYTIQIVNQTGWNQTITTETVNIANNSVQLVEFYSCNN